jgi:hypothetical protein
MVRTDKGRIWVGESDWGSDFKGVGYERINRNPPYMVFPAAAGLKSALPDHSVPLAAAILLAVGVEFHPLDGSTRPQ